MSSNIDHVLLTRFNLPSKGPENFIRSQEGWLHDRVELFERYCLPSVRRQTCKDFSWIIYFDPQSPQWLKDKISDWGREPRLTPIYREQVHREDLVHDLRRVTGAERSYLMTTNLDNDDGLAQDFVERLQGAATEEKARAVYLTHGLILNGGALYQYRDERNAFCSVVETWSDPVSCWVDWHNRLADHMSITEINGAPGWLQVVHGRNVSNRVRGRRVAAAPYTAFFGELIGDVRDPQWRDKAQERLWHTPRRLSYEVTRSAVKQITLVIGGKSALDKVKGALQRVRADT